MNVVGMEKRIHKRSLSFIMVMFMFLAVGLVWNGVVCNGEGRTALVTGMVFCDQCDLGSLSALSHPLAGAEVILECKQGLETASFFASTDENGVFSIIVEEEDGFEIHGAGRTCIVQLVKSNDLHCHVPTDMENGVSGAIISRTGGIYREKVVYYVGPFAYRVNHPPEACNAVKLNSRHAIRLQRSMVSLGSLRAKSRGLKTVLERGFGDRMLTIPSSAVTMPFTLGDGMPTIPSTAVTMPPSYNLPVTRPTPVDENPHLVKPPQVSRKPSPVKCLPLPPIPLDPDLAKLNIHYPPCKIQPPRRGGTILPPQTPDIPSPIGSSPPKDTVPKIGNGPPKDKSPSYGGPPMGKSSPPPPTAGLKPTYPSPPPPRHPIHRPHPHHR